jgi:hypothetical protein
MDNNIYDNFSRPDLSPADSRLQTDAFFGPLNYPDDLSQRDQYFREGLALFRTIGNQIDRVRMAVEAYKHYATDPALKTDLETFLQSLAKLEDLLTCPPETSPLKM